MILNGTTYMTNINSSNIDLYTQGIIEFATINNDKSLFYDMEKAKGKIDLLEAEKKLNKLREKQGIFAGGKTEREILLERELLATRENMAQLVAVEVANALAREKELAGAGAGHHDGYQSQP